MKNSGRITVIMLMLFMAGSLTLNAQRGMRGMRPDSARMGMMRMEHRQMPMCPMMGMRQQGMGMQHRGMGMWQMGPGMRMMGRGMGRQGMGMNGAPGIMRWAPGMRAVDNIPNLTDKQKKDIADLRQQQQVEMQKLRTDMQTKMKDMREAQRVKVIGLLNAEQKKWFEENSPKPLNK
jgi:hypothetical protein